ncbi:SMI1/KNR4 family protein [Neorhodopirellula pilleata]|uniref:Uncharacterized protein n=1 Tax=Neorhodopirellula pilleata TaxID=2714738 RepID=A0A5C6AN82_9BACT|nr:SMI1/KNR4 family protein [Neorhodopirellula pilleata]TWU01513.1 hypothetical protein Pla100_12480 [Neorhodopirellula pilleata]
MNAADSTADDEDPAQGSYAESVCERFGIPITEPLRQWWDAGEGRVPLWKTLGPGEYRHPATPESLLSEVPDAVWPPLMPPNFLPLVGNGIGDWLCLRLLDPDVAAATGRATDVCHWYHGGGDWLPWGNTLAEALLFDWMLPRLPQADRRHADPAEWMGGSSTDSNDRSPLEQTDHPWVQWAKSCLPAIDSIDFNHCSPLKLGQELIAAGLCEIPVRCQLTIDSLDSVLLNQLEPKSAHQLGLSWNDLMRWCFDLRELPESVAMRLQNELGVTPADFQPDQQQWDVIEEHAEAIAKQASDLSWGHDLLGYCRFRRGDHRAACESFRLAIRCSVFTDQSVRLRTHWATSSNGVAKFAARFLGTQELLLIHQHYENSMPESGVSGDLTSATIEQLGMVPGRIDSVTLARQLGEPTSENAESVRSRYSAMLMDAAKAAVDESPATAARLYYCAGWDLGAEPLKCYGELLDNYIHACHQAGWSGHERLARVHRRGLQSRYNL